MTIPAFRNSLFIVLVALSFAATDARAGWAVVPPASSNGQSDKANAVTCTSDSNCWAVGDRFDSQSGFPYLQTLIERWNGAAWTRIPSPNTNLRESNSLGGVACTSASDCWAVGYFQYTDDSFPFRQHYLQTLIQRWNGTTWSIVPSPNSNAQETNRLNDVACSSASDCWAVGYYTFRDNSPVFPQLRSKSLIQRWDGAKWSIVAAPTDVFLESVTCVSGSDCWAVGGGAILHWDGVAWSTVPEPRGTPENPVYLNDVTCTSASDCWAVGARVTGEERSETLIERWDGRSWTVVASPNPDDDGSGLGSVACSSPSDCSAVGGYFDGEANRTIIERWNGSSWTIVPSADPSTRINRLRSVTCRPSSSVCWAAGDQLDNASGSGRVLFQRFTPSPARLLNISTRAQVQTGENVMIGGFIVTGAAQKNVLLRAIGPSLNSSGVQGALQNPRLELFQGDVLVAENDNWKQSQQAEIAGTGVPPTNDLESAIVRKLAAGSYTAAVRGVDNQTGVGLVEAYDLDQLAGDSRLGNISTRALVQLDENALIGGVIVGAADAANSRVLVRAIGPSLRGSAVSAPLGDPTLELFDRDGVSIATNDNWKDSQQAEIEGTNAAPTDDRESAIIQSLPAGNYTAIVRGTSGATGVGLVEVYKLP